MQTAIPCSLMRGGTSKGLYFLAEHLPKDPKLRDKVLLAAMGSPDERQIDGVGGSHPLTSKVAIVSPSTRAGVDVDYLFLQVVVDKAEISSAQNCGNILAGVGAFAIEQGLVSAQAEYTDVRIFMVNTAGLSVAHIYTPNKCVEYGGGARIDGVPGTAAPILLNFLDIAGSSCGALFPTGSVYDTINDVQVTCIDNGMPVVIVRASDLGKTGYEEPELLEADTELKAVVEALRISAAEKMNLGDVSNKTIPKMSLISPAKKGGVLCTRTFIPHRVHEAIGVLGAVSVATAALFPDSVAQQVSGLASSLGTSSLEVEHPTGSFTVEIELSRSTNDRDNFLLEVNRAALLRTIRLLMVGQVMIPGSVWSGE